jgi:plastocyanin
MSADDSSGLSRRDFVRGAVGAGAVAAASGSATAQEGPVVDMTDGLKFAPEEIEVTPGTTITWENVGSVDHSVTAYEDDIPEDAEYWASGGFDSESAARDGWPSEGAIAGGESYQYTFETEGTYEYVCIPHEAAGMLGSVVVSTDAGSEGGGEPSGPVLPDSAKTLVVATVGAMVSTLALAFFFLKYGGDYGEVE